MKKRKAQKNIIKIAAMTSMTLFSLMAVFTGTLAWFNANRVVNQSGDNMQIESLSGIVDYVSVHHLKDEIDYLNDSSTMEFDSNYVGKYTVNWNTLSISYDKGDGQGVLGLNQYSLLSHTHPVLFLFKLNDTYNPEDVRIELEVPATINEEPNYWLEQVDSEGAPLLPLSITNNPFSSVVKYKTIGFQSLPDSLTISTSDLSVADSFVKISSNGNPDFSATQRKKTVTFSGNSTLSCLGIVFDYYQEAIEYIYSINIGNKIFDDLTSDIGFIFDWILRI